MLTKVLTNPNLIMNKYLLLLAFFASMLLHAQEFHGIATYAAVTTFKNRNLPKREGMDPAREARLKEMMSKAREKEFTLTFNKYESLYEEVEKLDPLSGNGRGRRFRNGKEYVNIKDKIALQEVDMFSKEFLVADTLATRKWVLVNETRKIGNYTCYKATYTIKVEPLTDEQKKKLEDKAVNLTDRPERTDITITAWYTPEVPVSLGPAGYHGLPGLILEVSDEHTTTLCTRLVINPKDKTEIKVPFRGEKVSREEFMAIMRKKSEEFMETRPAAPKGKSGTSTFIFGG